jgi:uncharacterized protein YkwD
VRPSRARPFAAVVALLLLGASHGAVAGDPGAALAEIEARIYAAVNEHRESRGQNRLTLDDGVSALARTHSEEMARGESGFGHDGFEARAGQIGKRMTVLAAAENIAKSSRSPSEIGAQAVPNWLTSKVHRKNIESRHQVTGVGAARSEDGTIYVTQIFVRTR